MAYPWELPFNLDPSSNVPGAYQGTYIAGGSAQPAANPLYSTQAAYSPNPASPFAYGGSAYSPWTTAPQNLPPVVPPVVPPKTPPVSNQQQGGGGSAAQAVLDAMNKGTIPWDDNLRSWANSQLQQPSGGGGISEQDLSAIYTPGMQALQSQEEMLRSQLPGAQQSIESQYGIASQEMETNRKAQEAALAKQEAGAYATKGSALAQARQLYNELAQRYAAQFGSRTSAGPFAMEILGRETQKQMGNIETSAQTAFTDISAERNRVMDVINTQKEKFALAKQDALREINVTFQTKLGEINARRGELESAKALARVQALNDAKNAALSVQSAQSEFDKKIYMFQLEKQKDFELLAAKGTAGSGYDTKLLDATNKLNDMAELYGPDYASQVAKASNIPWVPSTIKEEDKPWWEKLLGK